MSYCGPRGIPHSEFLSWPVDDQVKALGWQAEQRQACQQCGTADWEWEKDRHAYDVQPYVCPGCMKLEVARDEASRSAVKTFGLHYRLIQNGGGPDAGTHGFEDHDRRGGREG